MRVLALRPYHPSTRLPGVYQPLPFRKEISTISFTRVRSSSNGAAGAVCEALVVLRAVVVDAVLVPAVAVFVRHAHAQWNVLRRISAACSSKKRKVRFSSSLAASSSSGEASRNASS